MCVIGGYDKKYKDTLDDLIRNSHLENNIIFLGLQESSYDVYNLVSSSAIAVLPGLTSVNSTVRESLFLKDQWLLINCLQIMNYSQKMENMFVMRI